MSTGVRVHTDRASFETWARALSGVALPAELQPENTAGSADIHADEDVSSNVRPMSGTSVPPVVAASLALHGCAEAAVTVRITQPDGEAFGCFGLAGDLAAGLFRHGQEVEIGLFALAELVEQVVRLVPVRPLPVHGSVDDRVRITVLGADAAASGWQLTLVGGASRWRRVVPDGEHGRLEVVPDVPVEVAAELRLALAEWLDGVGGV